MKKKGFTLIELLVTIVILGLLMVLLVPEVLSTIEEFRLKSSIAAAENVVNSATNYFIDSKFDATKKAKIRNNQNVYSELDINGKLPNEGEVYITSKGSISLAMEMYNYCFLKDYDESTVSYSKMREGDSCVFVKEEVPSLCFDYKDNEDGGVTITNYLCANIVSNADYLFDEVEWLGQTYIVNYNEIINEFFYQRDHMENVQVYSDVSIPSVIEGKTVTEIGPLAFAFLSIDSVYIPSSVTKIDTLAFTGSNISNMTLSNSLESIGAGSISYNYLSEIKLPNTLLSIGEGAFAENQLKTIEIPESVNNLGSWVFYGNNITSVSFLNKISTIPEGLFSENQIYSLEIPETVTTIESEAFEDNNISKLTLHEGLVEIWYSAFENNNIESLLLPSTITVIDDEVFDDNHITSLEMGDSITYIGDCAFEDAELNQMFKLPNKLEYIGDYAFDKSLFYGDFVLPSTLEFIGISSFGYVERLTGNLNLPSGLEYIGSEAFAGFENVTGTISLPNTLKYIGSYAFYGNELTSVTIPVSVVTIENYAFSNNNWENVTIEFNENNSKFRFNSEWILIGWPTDLMIEPEAINGTLATTTLNNFPYFGSYYEFTASTSGRYKLEVWGAQGSTQSTNYTAGKWSGGYAYGTVNLTEGTTVYIYVGKAGGAEVGGFNGGADSLSSSTNDNGGGGGATDIRIGSTSLFSRVIVAGGGGGGRSSDNDTNGGMNILGTLGATLYGTGTSANCTYPGSFGLGGGYSGITYDDKGAGGGGWYGGCGYGNSRGGGGSNWLYTAENFTTWQTNNATDSANYLLNSTYYLTDTGSHSGSEAFTSPSGTTETGHSGNGFARITYIGE